jgi:hypothetical protein
VASWAYEVLGLEPTATDQEIREMYLRLARQLHPDQHPDASPEEREYWEDAMRQLNDAHDSLRDPSVTAAARMAAARPAATRVASRPWRPAWEPPPRRAPDEDECSRCGWSEATEVVFRQQAAWFIHSGIDVYGPASLCRDCGRGIGRSYQNRTLWTGWWGLRSFGRNAKMVWQNAQNLRVVGELELVGRDPAVETLVRRPMAPGGPVFSRAGFWSVLAAVIVLVAAIGVVVSRVGGSGAQTPAQTAWTVGACVDGGAAVAPVSCTQPHVGRITVQVTRADQCPTTAAINVVAPEGVYCIDRSQ